MPTVEHHHRLLRTKSGPRGHSRAPKLRHCVGPSRGDLYAAWVTKYLLQYVQQPEGVMPPTNPKRADSNHTLPCVDLQLSSSLSTLPRMPTGLTLSISFMSLPVKPCYIWHLAYARTSKVTSLDVDIIFTSNVNAKTLGLGLLS